MNISLKKYKSTLLILGFVVFVVFLVEFAALPLMNKINETQNVLEQRKTDLENKSKKLNDMPKYREQYEMLDKANGNIGKLLHKDDAVKLIEGIEKLANDTGNKISIEIFEKDKEVKNKTAKKDEAKKDESLVEKLPVKNYLEFKMTLKGDYKTISNFIYKLENFEYYSDIISLELATVSNDNEKVNVTPNQSGSPFQIGQSSEKPEDILQAKLDTIFYYEE